MGRFSGLPSAWLCPLCRQKQTHHPKGATLIRSAAVLSIALALSACTGPDDAPVSQPDPVVTATPSATAATSAPEPTSTPTSEPTLAPATDTKMVQATCPVNRERAGLEFEYDRLAVERADAVDQHCGIALVGGLCPSDRDRAGDEFQYDPDFISEDDAVDENCGSLAPIAGKCPMNRQYAEREYSYDPDEMTFSQARDKHCGKTAQQIIASCGRLTDEIVGQIRKTSRTLVGECYLMDVHIWQFDGATGPCMFLGSFSGFMDRGFNADRLSQFGTGSVPDEQSFTTNCPFLELEFEGDNILVYATYLGPVSYESGDRWNTVPAFKLEGKSTSR